MLPAQLKCEQCLHCLQQGACASRGGAMSIWLTTICFWQVEGVLRMVAVSPIRKKLKRVALPSKRHRNKTPSWWRWTAPSYCRRPSWPLVRLSQRGCTQLFRSLPLKLDSTSPVIVYCDQSYSCWKLLPLEPKRLRRARVSIFRGCITQPWS